MECTMQQILDLIKHRQKEYTQIPFFRFLADSTIHPYQRLSFVPCFSPFVMGFGELNRSVIRDDSSTDPVQLLLNQHSREDDGHWVWFLQDLKELGLDPIQSFTTSLEMLWNDELEMSRRMIYELYHRTCEASPTKRLVIIEAVEATADVFLGATSAVIAELQQSAIGQGVYRYFGSLHFEVDASHEIYSTDKQTFIRNIKLSEEEAAEARKLVEWVFQLFETFMQYLLDYAQRYIDSPAHLRTSTRLAKPLGAYLIEAGLLSNEQLNVALLHQRSTGKRLGEVVSEKGWVPSQTIEYIVQKVMMPDRKLLSIDRQATPLAS